MCRNLGLVETLAENERETEVVRDGKVSEDRFKLKEVIIRKS